jgi:rRNA pseudouridine-1189 N-methylase Emg1 (Nep1/Mra1 family)
MSYAIKAFTKLKMIREKINDENIYISTFNQLIIKINYRMNITQDYVRSRLFVFS